MSLKISRKAFIKKSFSHSLKWLALLPIVAMTKEVWGRNVHSKLTDENLLAQFQSISTQLACVCGKSMPLTQINDFGHCNTWPMRAVVDGLLEDSEYGKGMSPAKKEKLILDGFVGGFGELAKTHKAFEKARSEQYNYLMSGFIGGFGESILSTPRSKNPIILAGVFGSLMIGGLLYFLKTRHKKLATENSSAVELTEEEKKLMDKINL